MFLNQQNNFIGIPNEDHVMCFTLVLHAYASLGTKFCVMISIWQGIPLDLYLVAPLNMSLEESLYSKIPIQSMKYTMMNHLDDSP